MKKLILIVDDEEPIRAILTEFLGSHHYRVTAVSSASEAREAVRREAPNLIISDLQLEESDGLEMIRQLKSNLQDTPVILLTGMIFDPRVAEELASKGVSAYLPKATPLVKILAEVSRLIGPA